MNIALVLSGGTGSRLGTKVPKQYLACEGRMMITRCLETVFSHPALDAVQIVVAEEWREAIDAIIRKWKGYKVEGLALEQALEEGANKKLVPSAFILGILNGYQRELEVGKAAGQQIENGGTSN